MAILPILQWAISPGKNPPTSTGGDEMPHNQHFLMDIDDAEGPRPAVPAVLMACSSTTHGGGCRCVAHHEGTTNPPFSEHDPAETAPCLPQGCVTGTPVFTGIAAEALPEGKALFNVAMSFVEADDYHGILELARHGRTRWVSTKCSFSVALRPEAGSMCEAFPRQLRVSSASLLHYAVCIGSFCAVAAICVVSPHLLAGKCLVSVGEHEEAGPAERQTWSASQLGRILSLLYQDESTASIDTEAAVTGALYKHALPLLIVGEQDPAQLPFLGLPTMTDRIAAAGPDANPVIEALASFAAAAPCAAGEDVEMVG